MTPDLSQAATAKSRAEALAVVVTAAWATAAFSTRWIGIWVAIGGAAVLLGAVVWILDGAAGRSALQPSLRRVLLGAAAGCAMAAVTYVLYPVTVRLAPFVAADTARLYWAFRAPLPAVAALALLPVVVGEELVWRGVVQGALVRRLGPWGGVPMAAVAYALAHVPVGSPVLVAAALFCGIAFGALRAATASLVPTLVAHLAWDAVVMLWLPLQ